MSTPEFPSAAEILALLAAEHAPFDARSPNGSERVQYCRACSTPSVIRWPCRIHILATQPTRELVERGLRWTARDD